VTFSVQARSLPQDHRISISGALPPQPPKGGSSFGARPRIPPLLSPRTAKYVEAMVRDDFNYDKWLKRVREEEAEAKQAQTAINVRGVVAARVDNLNNASRSRALRPPLISKQPLNLRTLGRPHRQAKSKTPEDQLRRWLEKVHRAWSDFQGSRRRDAVYAFLQEVYTMVEHHKVRRRTKRLLRHAFKFANLQFDKNADPFSAVIRCTCGNAADSKTISKWARALRYVARSKAPDTDLRKFMKGAGGINGCAARSVQSRRCPLLGVKRT
jgi:hypothetical protein